MNKTIEVGDYNIYIGSITQTISDWGDLNQYGRIFILVDENTKLHCLPLLSLSLPDEKIFVIEIPSGESHKNIQTAIHIWQSMMTNQAGRRDLTINLGGGVIGDMGGFCASTFKRGMDFIQIPTTLLAQVDASIGGKLGIDFESVKNSIGLFKNPNAVCIDPAFLKTLPQRELRSGFAEIIKHSLIADEKEWEKILQLSAISPETVTPFIIPSILVKQSIVQEDPFEKGIRKILNFGHTIGHAIESYALKNNQSLLHGEAVAIGMICEAYLSYLQADFPKSSLTKLKNLIFQHYDKYELDPNTYPELLKIMYQDKKNEDHRINFTMLKQAGKALFNQFADETAIIESLNYYRNA